jgi:hypothetical protein
MRVRGFSGSRRQSGNLNAHASVFQSWAIPDCDSPPGCRQRAPHRMGARIRHWGLVACHPRLQTFVFARPTISPSASSKPVSATASLDLLLWSPLSGLCAERPWPFWPGFVLHSPQLVSGPSGSRFSAAVGLSTPHSLHHGVRHDFLHLQFETELSSGNIISWLL